MRHPLWRRMEYPQCHLAVVQVEGVLWFHRVYLEHGWLVVYPTVRLRARGTDMSPDSLVVCVTQHQDDNAEEPLVVVVDTAAMFWLADGYMLAIECSTTWGKFHLSWKAWATSRQPSAVVGVRKTSSAYSATMASHTSGTNMPIVLCAARQLNSIDWKESPVARNRSVMAIFRPGSNGRRNLKAHNIV